MQTQVTFWQTFFGLIVKPVSTLFRLQKDERAGQKGLWVLLLVLGSYTLILGIFILRAYPAAAPTILPIAVEDVYKVQIWYQGPLFFVSTLVLTGLLLWLARLKGQVGDFATVFARVSFATTVPFALTTMLVELVIALLVLVGVFQPQELLGWLTGAGLWFANTYQLAGILWLIGLLVITTKLSVPVRWGLGVVLGALLAVIYGVPIALFVR